MTSTRICASAPAPEAMVHALLIRSLRMNQTTVTETANATSMTSSVEFLKTPSSRNWIEDTICAVSTFDSAVEFADTNTR